MAKKEYGQAYLKYKSDPIRGERKFYYEMLKRHVDLDSLGVPSNPRVLSVGCGDSVISTAVNSYFGRVPFGHHSDKVKFVGVDIQKECIEEAKKMHRGMGSAYRFVCADLSKLEDAVEGRFDVVIAAHPLMKKGKEWPEIAKVHRKGGVLVGTFVHDHEMILLLNQIRAEYDILHCGKNEYYFPGVAGGFHDFMPIDWHSHIAVAQKR